MFWGSHYPKTKTIPSSELLDLETHKTQLLELEKYYLKYSYSRICNIIMSQNTVKIYQANILSFLHTQNRID